MNKIKQIPYGVADFVSVKERNLYYADKTMFLQETASIMYANWYCSSILYQYKTKQKNGSQKPTEVNNLRLFEP